MQISTIQKPRIRLRVNQSYKTVQEIVRHDHLHTVCESARCPNIFECWGRGTATIMILGDICTRSCGFCSVKTGRPDPVAAEEPTRTAQAVKKMGLSHVVITSVDRDDLKADFGAFIWAETVRQIHFLNPDCTVEVLTPDFRGYKPALREVFAAKPDIFSHNLECVPRISRQVRPQADWFRSLSVLEQSIAHGLPTKTGLMVGLGETMAEVEETMRSVAILGVKIFTIGQYLQPTRNHLPVQRYVSEQEFQHYRQLGLQLGFKVVESGSLVRSSYHAEEQVELLNGRKT
ncbi:MAG: lipoyl synthase [Fidelibacterota bacterium]